MGAATRKFLKVNLSIRKIIEEPILEKVAIDFIGGSGFGISYLYQESMPNTDPLAEDNKLLLVTGPLTGTSAQSVSRWMACTRSPLTGAFARSVCGADFGAWLRFSGYDFILIEGKAERPVYLHLAEMNTGSLGRATSAAIVALFGAAKSTMSRADPMQARSVKGRNMNQSGHLVAPWTAPILTQP